MDKLSIKQRQQLGIYYLPNTNEIKKMVSIKKEKCYPSKNYLIKSLKNIIKKI